MSEQMPEAATEDRELAKAQLETADPEAKAASDEEIKTGEVEFRGEKFHVAEEVGAVPMLMFSAAANAPKDSLEAGAAIWRVIEDVLHEKEFARFSMHALMARPKPQVEELLEFVNKAQEIITGTPTEQQDGSSTS